MVRRIITIYVMNLNYLLGSVFREFSRWDDDKQKNKNHIVHNYSYITYHIYKKDDREKNASNGVGQKWYINWGGWRRRRRKPKK